MIRSELYNKITDQRQSAIDVKDSKREVHIQ
jgi:hypothetical protein